MKDKFADLEEPKSRTLRVVIAVIVIIAVISAFGLFNPKPIKLSGVVESLGSANSTTGQPSVRLDDGTLITVSRTGNPPIAAGDRVVVVEQRKLFGRPSYTIDTPDSSQ